MNDGQMRASFHLLWTALNYWSFDLFLYCSFLRPFTIKQSILSIDHQAFLYKGFLEFHFPDFISPLLWDEEPQVIKIAIKLAKLHTSR